jgi:hypothetical protein
MLLTLSIRDARASDGCHRGVRILIDGASNTQVRIDQAMLHLWLVAGVDAAV